MPDSGSPAGGVLLGCLLSLVAWWLIFLICYMAAADVRSWLG